MSDGRKELEEQDFKWIDIADEDLLLAKHEFSLESKIPHRLIAYRTQQCAEKYFKAFHVILLIEFTYTHNLEALVILCEKEIYIKEKLKIISILSQFKAAKHYLGINCIAYLYGRQTGFYSAVSHYVLFIHIVI